MQVPLWLLALALWTSPLTAPAAMATTGTTTQVAVATLGATTRVRAITTALEIRLSALACNICLLCCFLTSSHVHVAQVFLLELFSVACHCIIAVVQNSDSELAVVFDVSLMFLQELATSETPTQEPATLVTPTLVQTMLVGA